jgi:hypothetical protein
VDLLAAGAHLQLHRPDGTTIEATVDAVGQRAWSRTASAHSADGSALFLKQFVSRSGAPGPHLLDGELTGAQVAAEILRDLDVCLPVAASTDALVLAYEWQQMTPLDELLRRAPAQFETSYDAVVQACAADLRRCRDARPAIALSGKRTETAQRGVGVVFKAFELRNVAVRSEGSRPVVFDLGRPRLGPIEEAAARVFVSAALLNWGRPVSRFLRGPDESVLTRAWEHLRDTVTVDACLAELDHQYATRSRDDALTYGSLVGPARRTAVRLLGGRYRRRVRAFLSSR